MLRALLAVKLRCKVASAQVVPTGVLASVIVIAIILWSVWSAHQNYELLIQHEYEMLDQRAKARDARISGALRTINLMMNSLIEDMRDQPDLDAVDQGKLFRNYLRQLPELRNIVFVDSNGKIRADARDIAIGSDASGREYFRHHKATPQSVDAYYSRPFKTFSGLIGYTASHSYCDRNGNFIGVLVASIDARFLAESMSLEDEKPELEALLINTQGDIFTRVPRREHTGENLIGGIAFTEHTKSGLEVSQHLNIVKFEPVMRMSVFRNFKNAPFTIIVSTEYGLIFRQWMRSELTNVIRLIFLIAATIMFYFLATKRQNSLIAAQNKIEERELNLLKFKSIIDHTEDAVISKSLEGIIQTWNRGAEKLFGYSSEEAIGKNIQLVIPIEKLNEELSLLGRIAKGERIESFETVRSHKTGKLVNISATLSPIYGDSENVTGISTIARDISERISTEARIGYLATHDSLTGLPNRDLLYDRLSQAISTGRRMRETSAIFFLDLDGFKAINDTFGHEAGDKTLKEAARRMLSCIRETDTLARLGGDEFAIILNAIRTVADVKSVANKILKWIADDINLDGDKYARIGVSIGIALYPADGNEIDSLLKAADSAMYKSKTSGKNRYTFYSDLELTSTEQADWVDISGPHMTGHSGIDAQHLEIAKMLNDFSAALQVNDDHDSLIERLNNLVSYVGQHFEFEEKLMDQFNYPGSEPHKNAHQALLREIETLKKRFLQGGEEFVLQWLKDWLLGHIGSSDKQLGYFLERVVVVHE
ncbi:MAG TPA: hypothetical protein DE312_03910 [Gallionella sp.]|nr:MAG: hypothetical protein A2Z87_05545 [Gallionellales bacterium GWA2_54_124]OGT18092.1 MAG: hypothetical protein A2522_08975 [Gallionellales bacterium RIFOXYD12_FULL_53_10]HCI52455.1 hypothetical protein [Gallionella sp.]